MTRMSDNYTRNRAAYVRYQFDKLDTSATLKIKVRGGDSETHWISVPPGGIHRVADALIDDEITTTQRQAAPMPLDTDLLAVVLTDRCGSEVAAQVLGEYLSHATDTPPPDTSRPRT